MPTKILQSLADSLGDEKKKDNFVEMDDDDGAGRRDVE